MIYLEYLLVVPVSLIVTFIGLLLAPILPLFATQQYGWTNNHSVMATEPRLPKCLSWFMTPDNSLYGDDTFKSINGTSYLSMIKWLLRNPAYGFELRYLFGSFETSIHGNPSIKDNDNAKEGYCFVTANGLFQFRYIKQIPFTQRCILINLGWNIMALVDPNVKSISSPYQATFVFSPRISGFR